MKSPQVIPQKILNLSQIQHQVRRWRVLGKSFAFTNGCFDILHRGHISSLSDAAREADFLVVGVNSDASVRKLKGHGRPINDQDARALALASLMMVDAVVIFDEDTPHSLISTLLPDVLVKGGDYTIEMIVGAKEVIENGGKVVVNPLVEGYSTTGLINKIHSL